MQTLASKSIENETRPLKPDTVVGTSEPDLSKLACLIRAHTPHDGCFELRIPGVYAIRRSRISMDWRMPRSSQSYASSRRERRALCSGRKSMSTIRPVCSFSWLICRSLPRLREPASPSLFYVSC
jgi:hypothetical protein